MESIVTGILGIVFIVLGFVNRTGNVSMLHSYHRKRVKEEDKIPFGKLVGTGMFFIGGALIVFSILSLLSIVLKNELFITIGDISLFVGIAVGTTISFYAMKKYNKGIF